MGSSSKSQVMGYRYFMGVHMGLGHAADEIVEIRVGERPAWRMGYKYTAVLGEFGKVKGWQWVPDPTAVITGNTTVFIGARELFGGDDGEGGIVGNLDVLMGGPTQTAPAGLAAMLGGTVPGFRGKVTAFFDGQICGNSPYPKPWSWRRRRVTSGWDGDVWYPEKATIWLGSGTGVDGIKAMNPAHILYELYTNRKYARGASRTRIDDAQWRAAADQLHAEGFGLCLEWKRQGTVRDFIDLVLDHIHAACGPDLSTGKIRLKLLRGDYDPEALPLFTYGSGLLSILQEEVGAADTQYNQVSVKWRDPLDFGREKTSPPVKNLGSIQSHGLRSTVNDYPGLPVESLAIRCAARDLRMGGLTRYKLLFDRRAYAIQVGDAFRIADPARGLSNIVLRALRVEDSPLLDGKITITAVQDMFGLPATAYVQSQLSGWVAPDPTPSVPTERRLFEVPYYALSGSIDPANFALLDANAGFVAGVAKRPAGLTLDYGLATRTGSAAFIERATGQWCPTAVTTAIATPGQTAVTLTAGTDLDFVEPGTPALWDNEIVRVDAIDAVTGACTLARGCADTVPALHAAGSRLWFFDGQAGIDPSEYLSGETVNVKMLTHTSTGTLSETVAPTDSLTLTQRQYRPYAPGNLKLNSVAYPAYIGGALTVSWAHRDRLLQADQLVDTTAASVGPEAGTTYELSIYNRAGTLVKAVTGLTGTTYIWSTEAADAGELQGQLRVVLRAKRDGLDSSQAHDFIFDRAGYGLNYGLYYGGGA